METKNAFLLAGYSKKDITPEESVPLYGLGNTLKRMSVDVRDNIYLTCIALTDTDNKTVLLYTVDICNVNLWRTNKIRHLVSEATGVDENDVIITATHNHSGPDPHLDIDCVNAFYEKYFSAAVEAAKDALADRVPAAMMIGRTKTEKLNFCRHYYAEDGGAVSDNHDSRKSPDAKIIGHMTESDPTLHIIRFVRNGVTGEVLGEKPQDKKDILYINWRAHATKIAATRRYSLSADYPEDIVRFVEHESDFLCAYYQGAAGNVNPNSRILEEKTNKYCSIYGAQIGAYVLDAIKDEVLHDVPPGKIKHIRRDFTYDINHAGEENMEAVYEAQRIWKETNKFSLVREYSIQFGIYSPFHANAIASRFKKEKTATTHLNAITISNVGLAYAPGELFDMLSTEIKEKSPFEETLVMGYSCESIGYIPSKEAFDYGCYEADCTNVSKGTGEKIADELLDMLNCLKNK